jgi:hypothetical protein
VISLFDTPTMMDFYVRIGGGGSAKKNDANDGVPAYSASQSLDHACAHGTSNASTPT